MSTKVLLIFLFFSYLILFNTKFPIFPIFLFFLSNHAPGHPARCFFPQKYIAEIFSRGQSFHSASFLIDFLFTKANFFRSFFPINRHREQAASFVLADAVF